MPRPVPTPRGSGDGAPPVPAFFARIADVAGFLARAVESVAEVVADPSLRRRGADIVADEAAKLSNSIERGANTAIEAGVTRLQSLLEDIEHKVSSYQQDAAARRAALHAVEGLPATSIDLQLGGTLLEDVPRELRARLYCVLATRDDMAAALQAQLMEQIAPGTAPSSDSAASQRAASSSTAGRGEEAADDASGIVPPPVGANGHSPHLQQQQLPRPQAGGLSAFSGSLGPTAADPTVGTSSNGPPEATGAGAAQGTSVGAAPSLLAPRPPYSEAALLQAMHEVPWDAAAGRPMPMSDGALAQLAAAQHVAALQRCVGGLERVDDIIARDLPRTFPDHPFYATGGEGQARLGRLLRAYALADDEVGYCQGMAFPAGLLLLHVPEGAAWTLFRRLMDEPPAGAGLRHLYLPGLEHLKVDLAAFDTLLSHRLPALHAHLAACGVPPLLYASQWLMTCYAASFPLHVAGRALDCLLQARCDALLLRLGLAVMEGLQRELISAADFEAAVIAIKVSPLKWGVLKWRAVFARALGGSLITDGALRSARRSAAAQAAAARAARPGSFVAARSGSRRLVLTDSNAAAGTGAGDVGGSSDLPATRPPAGGPTAASAMTAAGAPGGAPVAAAEALAAGPPTGLVAPCSSLEAPSLTSLAAMSSLTVLGEECDLEVTLSQLHLIVPPGVRYGDGGVGGDDDGGGGGDSGAP